MRACPLVGVLTELSGLKVQRGCQSDDTYTSLYTSGYPFHPLKALFHYVSLRMCRQSGDPFTSAMKPTVSYGPFSPASIFLLSLSFLLAVPQAHGATPRLRRGLQVNDVMAYANGRDSVASRKFTIVC